MPADVLTTGRLRLGWASVLSPSFAASYLLLSALSIVYLPARVVQLEPDQHVLALAAVSTSGTLAVILSQPIVGWLSDHTRSRWGRRAPWIAACALATAVLTPVLGLTSSVIDVGFDLAGVSFDLRSIEAPVWQKVLDFEDQKRALGDDIAAIPTGKWNRLIGRLLIAIDRAVREPDVVDLLRAAVSDITDQADRELVYQVISPLVVWEAEDLETVRNDPRVALTSGELIGAPAMCLAENPAGDLEDIYGWDLEDELDHDEPFRNLSRIGGTPSRVTGLRLPEDAFLLQIDFRGIPKDHSGDPRVLRLLQSTGVPDDGLLQVFHTTTGDSRTDPDVPCGGATLRYVPETSLAKRLPLDLDAECAVYPPTRAQASFGLSFRNGPITTDRSSETVIELQRLADIWARSGSFSSEFEASTDPFTRTEQPVTRMFGVQGYDFDLPDEDVNLLHRELPLVGDDRHVLLLNITGERGFDSVFGDGGRLEIWIRDTDLRAARFASVVSFIRST